MKDFIAYIVKNLVDNPDNVRISEIGGTQTLIVELSVDKSDIGKVIGKKGKTINAIRSPSRSAMKSVTSSLATQPNAWPNSSSPRA